MVLLVDHFAKLLNLSKVDLVGKVLVQVLTHPVKDAYQLQPVLLASVLSALVLLCTPLQLLVKLVVSAVELIESLPVSLNISAVLPELHQLVILNPGQVSLQLHLVRELVLDRLLHLVLDLAALLFALLDQRRHSVVRVDEDVHAAFEQLTLGLLVLALIRLSLQLKPDSLDLADQVGLLVSVAQQQSLVLAYLPL